MITITTNLKQSVSFLSDFCFNQNKNKLCSLHSPVFFKILKELTLLQKQTIPHMKAFLELERQGRGATPTPCNIVCIFSFWGHGGMEAKWGWWNKNWMFYIKSPYLKIKIIGFWLECSSEIHQFESADPVYIIFVISPFFLGIFRTKIPKSSHWSCML